MKLTYFQLLSSDPVYIPGVGGIISPRLKDISAIGENMYQYYLNILLMDLKMLFTMMNRLNDYEMLTEEKRLNLSVFDLLSQDVQSAIILQDALNFFIKENVEYSIESKEFAVMSSIMVKEQDTMTEKYSVIGTISRDNYQDVVNAICQRNNVKIKNDNDITKTKSKKALLIMQKLKSGREKMAKTVKVDKDMELGNIISAVANKSHSLNIINIWELTIFQLWDCFARLSNNNIYDINAASVSAWGDKDNKFDFGGWYKKIND